MLKILFPILLLVGAIFFGKYLLDTGPEAKKRPFVQRMPVVEVVPLKTANYTVTLKASGIVQAGTQTNLVSEVSGRILSISPKFLEGSYFDKNEALLRIDSSNYKNALAISTSDVAGSRASLDQIKEEQKSTKRSIQLARKNLKLGKAEVSRLSSLWKKKLVARSVVDSEEQKLNLLQQKLDDAQGRLNTYKSRKLAVEAKTSAAQARSRQEKLNISRATIKTPYQGRVLKKDVDIGQFVSTGTKLGTVYATDYVYVNLPLSLSRYELLGLADSFQNKKTTSIELPEVIFNNPSSNHKSTWKGQITRTSAALDAESRQITVIARIDKPFELREGISSPLRIGQYLDAKIKGKTFTDVYVLPPVAVRHNKEILLLKDGKISVVPVDLIWSTSKESVVRIEQKINSEQLIVTALSQAINGMSVITLEDQRKINSDKKDMADTEDEKKKGS